MLVNALIDAPKIEERLDCRRQFLESIERVMLDKGAFALFDELHRVSQTNFVCFSSKLRVSLIHIRELFDSIWLDLAWFWFDLIQIRSEDLEKQLSTFDECMEADKHEAAKNGCDLSDPEHVFAYLKEISLMDGSISHMS